MKVWRSNSKIFRHRNLRSTQGITVIKKCSCLILICKHRDWDQILVLITVFTQTKMDRRGLTVLISLWSSRHQHYPIVIRKVLICRLRMTRQLQRQAPLMATSPLIPQRDPIRLSTAPRVVAFALVPTNLPAARMIPRNKISRATRQVRCPSNLTTSTVLWS